MDLTEKQWAVLGPLLPKPRLRKDRRGRPWRDPRDVLNGILWVLRTGSPWADLPERYPPYQTCHRRFQQWVRSGIMRGVLEALALCALVHKRLGPWLKWYVTGFEIRRNVQNVLGAAGFPDSGQVRMAIGRSWRWRGEVGLTIRPLRNSAGRDFHPLAIDRRTNQYCSTDQRLDDRCWN